MGFGEPNLSQPVRPRSRTGAILGCIMSLPASAPFFPMRIFSVRSPFPPALSSGSRYSSAARERISCQRDQRTCTREVLLQALESGQFQRRTLRTNRGGVGGDATSIVRIDSYCIRCGKSVRVILLTI